MRLDKLPLFLRPPFPALRRVLRSTTFVALLLAIELAYLFLVTAGTFTEWPTYNELYDSLAQGFRKGHLYLPIEPSPELLATPNPFDPANGALWFADLSLYKGKYYIYWGPFPALAIWAVKSVFRIRKVVGDQYPCFAFYALYAIAGALLLARMARRLFPGLPHYLLLLSIAVFACASPAPYLVATPGIYEAAIAGEQAFLLVGILLAFDALGGVRRWSALRLLLAGSAWGIAITCRVSAAPAIFSLAVLTALVPHRDGRRWRMALRDFALVSLPVALTIAALLVYNKERFDSWFEFGTNLQLSTLHYRGGLQYLRPNLYSYFLRRPSISCEFPFATAPWDMADAFPAGYPLPEDYWRQEPVVGMLVVVPWVWLVPLGFFFLAKNARPRAGAPVPQRDAASWSSLWCAAVFVALATVTGLPIIAMFGATMRYLGDISAGIILFATWGAWSLYQVLRRRKWLRRAYGSVLTALAAVTVVLGLLLGFQGYGGHFKFYNVALHDELISKLSRCR